MISYGAPTPPVWMRTGAEAFANMLSTIDLAQRSICLESYIYTSGVIGTRFLAALVSAAKRGVRVRVLVDSLGSLTLPASFWHPLTEAGGQVRFFNPLSLHRLGIRDHRKLLVCDSNVAFVGGFNIADEYDGDGVSKGWLDLGLRLEGEVVRDLEASFDEMFPKADFQHKRFMRFRRSSAKRSVVVRDEQLLLSGPGRGRSPIKRMLSKDLAGARNVKIIIAYFLPTWRLRRDLAGVVRRGGTVDLILAGRSDVVVSQLAAQSLYRRFLRAGARIFEYQPQVLHAKLIIIDGIVYAGSANLDQRSLNINYELMLRFENPAMAVEALEIFESIRGQCQQITRESWKKGRTLWRRLKQRWAYWLLVRIDPYLARRQWRALPD